MSISTHLQKLPPLLLLIAFFPCTLSAGEEELDITDFTAITVSGGVDISITQGENYSVTLKSMLGDTDNILVDASNGKLTISKKSSMLGFLNWLVHYRAEISLPQLETLHASGGSDVRGEGVFTAEQLKLMASGGSDIIIEVDVNSLEIKASGGSDIKIDGNADKLLVEISGGSDLNASRLEVKEASITTTGGSDSKLKVLDGLTIRASGGSDISYQGDPQFTDIDATGGSKVTQR